MAKHSDSLRVMELFAGVGGFRLGLERSGWQTVFANQWEPSTKSQAAFGCYQAHFSGLGENTNVDIAQIVRDMEEDSRSIPGVDMIVGGFPCQDYSVAKTLNSAKGLEGKKGVLWWEIHALVRMVKPKFVFLENVDRLLKSPAAQKGRDFAIMLRTLGDLGYCIEWRVVNAAEAGFAQRRIRVYIVASKISKTQKLDPVKMVNQTGTFARAFPIQPVSDLASVHLSADPVDITSSFGVGSAKSPFLNAGVYVNGTAYTAKVELAELTGGATLGSCVSPDSEVPEEFWVSDEKLEEWKRLKGKKTITRVHKASGFVFNYSEGSMAFPDSLDRPSRTIVTGEGGTSPSRFKHIIRTAKGYRRLMPVELERLNGFPDDWTKFDDAGNQISDVKRAFFMGNALVVGVVEKIGAVIAEDLSKSRLS